MADQDQLMGEIKRQGYNSYSSFSYRLLKARFDSKDSFLQNEKLHFEEYVGSKTLSGNELLYYPQLALKIRALTDYPLLVRDYSINAELAGIDLLQYLAKKSKESLSLFMKELKHISKRFDQLLLRYGKRITPLIENIEFNKLHDTPLAKKITINGVNWEIGCSHYHNDRFKSTEGINFLRLLNIENNVSINIEDFLPFSPFLVLRVYSAKNWYNKGHIEWYNLDTRQRAYKKERDKWINQHRNNLNQ